MKEIENKNRIELKQEVKDDYNLINSRAIADYCRNIQYQFNTEELAILVYRNRRMNIDEKIKKYQDLIANYADMEVIERVNCKHYDSVKIMIQQEITRLEKQYKDLTQDDDNAIYSWIELNQSTGEGYCNNLIRNAQKTYQEIQRVVQDYINKFDDIKSFRIIKKYFGKRERILSAEYNIVNKIMKLTNISEEEDYLLDINNIFVNIPTPFKKGDILISNSTTMRNYGDLGRVFVLDYLCTWKKDLKEYLAKGNYDSSDMVGYGYYLYEDNAQFVRDTKWDYDSFEFYDGKFEGNNRILKNINSFLKGKISLELFVHAYDWYKTEYECKNQILDIYTDEELEIAGMSKEDIYKINYAEELRSKIKKLN